MSAERRENAFWKRRNKSRVRTQESRLSVKMNGPTKSSSSSTITTNLQKEGKKGRTQHKLRTVPYEPYD